MHFILGMSYKFVKKAVYKFTKINIKIIDSPTIEILSPTLWLYFHSPYPARDI